MNRKLFCHENTIHLFILKVKDCDILRIFIHYKAQKKRKTKLSEIL
jgi:hypothetical protein